MKKIKAIFCIFFGHSNVVKGCFGYIHCARCNVQIGDTLAGAYRNDAAVLVGHNCNICKENYRKLSWKDKFLAPNPF